MWVAGASKASFLAIWLPVIPNKKTAWWNISEAENNKKQKHVDFGPSQRSIIISKKKNTELDQQKIDWIENPAKKRTKRMKISTAKTAADRFKAATAKAQSSGGLVMKNQSTEEKAQAIYTLLKAEGVIKK